MKNERAPPKLSPIPQRTIEYTYTYDDVSKMRGYTWNTFIVEKRTESSSKITNIDYSG